MNVSGFLQKFSGFVRAEPPAQQSQASSLSTQLRRPAPGDGFDRARRAPVDLGRVAPASSASDADFVIGLYRDLLGRAPDLEGFHSHMRGLEAGVSREELRQIFLGSAEYRQKQAAAATPAPAPPDPPTPPTPPTPPPARPSPIAGVSDFDAAYPQIKRMPVVASANACPGDQQTFWVQALVRGRANNGRTATPDEMKAVVQKSGGDLETYTREMIRAVAAKMHRPLSREEARVVIYKVQVQYLPEVQALMLKYG